MTRHTLLIPLRGPPEKNKKKWKMSPQKTLRGENGNIFAKFDVARL